MRILYITDSFPYPPVSGDRVRSYNLLRRVADKHQVWLAALLETQDEVKGVSHMQEFCTGVEVATTVRRHPLAHLPGLVPYALAGKPLELKFKHSKELAQQVRRLVATQSFDIVHIVNSHMAPYLDALPPNACCKCVLEFLDVAFDQFARIFRVEQRASVRFRALIYSRTMRRWEPRYAERFDGCITVSELDRNRLLKANPRLHISVVPNGVDTRLYQPLPEVEMPPALLFVGKMSYPPCTDAIVFFCSEILPRIRRRIGHVEVWAVGKEPVAEVMRLQGNGVHVTGQVDSVLPYYRRSTVCVVPLRSGGGTRLKILEAMAFGRPVVSTSIGCEGLDVVDGEHLLIADSPEEFAEKTYCLLQDKALRERITTNARQLVVGRYDWNALTMQLLEVYARIAR